MIFPICPLGAWHIGKLIFRHMKNHDNWSARELKFGIYIRVDSRYGVYKYAH